MIKVVYFFDSQCIIAERVTLPDDIPKEDCIREAQSY